MDGILVPISLFVLIGAVAVAIEYFKYRRRQDQQITVRTAIDKGEGLSADVLESIANPKMPPGQDLRRGIVLIALGLGIGAFGFILGEADAIRPLMATSAIPSAIGLGFIIWWLIRKRVE